MKPNTSNDEHEFDKRDRKIDADFNQAIGYAKALDDVEKIIQTFNFKLYIADDGTFMYSAMKKALIAKLSHSQQVTDKQNRMLKSSSDASQKTADTHIPKESK